MMPSSPQNSSFPPRQSPQRNLPSTPLPPAPVPQSGGNRPAPQPGGNGNPGFGGSSPQTPRFSPPVQGGPTPFRAQATRPSQQLPQVPPVRQNPSPIRTNNGPGPGFGGPSPVNRGGPTPVPMGRAGPTRVSTTPVAPPQEMVTNYFYFIF